MGKPTTCVRNRKVLKPKLVEQLKTQFRAFVDVKTETKRSMLPRFKPKSTEINIHMYIEQITINFAKKMSQLQACTRRDLSCKSFECFLIRITTSIRMLILHMFCLPSGLEANRLAFE